VSVPGGEFEVRSDQVAAVGEPLLAAAEPLDEAVQRRRVDDGIPALVGRRGGIPATQSSRYWSATTRRTFGRSGMGTPDTV